MSYGCHFTGSRSPQLLKTHLGPLMKRIPEALSSSLILLTCGPAMNVPEHFVKIMAQADG